MRFSAQLACDQDNPYPSLASERGGKPRPAQDPQHPSPPACRPPRPPLTAQLRCRIEPYIDQERRLRRRWPGTSVGLWPWGPRPTRAGPTRCTAPLISQAHQVMSACCAVRSSSAGRLSCSRPPCLGRSLRSRRTRSASPNPDTAIARRGPAPVEEDGEVRALLIAGNSSHERAATCGCS